MEMRTATIHTRIKPSLKKRAEEIFNESGHTPSDVLEQFYILTVKKGKVPIRLTRRRANIPDENLMTPDEIKAMLAEAEKSLDKQIESGKYITSANVKEALRERYGIRV